MVLCSTYPYTTCFWNALLFLGLIHVDTCKINNSALWNSRLWTSICVCVCLHLLRFPPIKSFKLSHAVPQYRCIHIFFLLVWEFHKHTWEFSLHYGPGSPSYWSVSYFLPNWSTQNILSFWFLIWIPWQLVRLGIFSYVLGCPRSLTNAYYYSLANWNWDLFLSAHL